MILKNKFPGLKAREDNGIIFIESQYLFWENEMALRLESFGKTSIAVGLRRKCPTASHSGDIGYQIEALD